MGPWNSSSSCEAKQDAQVVRGAANNNGYIHDGSHVFSM